MALKPAASMVWNIGVIEQSNNYSSRPASDTVHASRCPSARVYRVRILPTSCVVERPASRGSASKRPPQPSTSDAPTVFAAV
jgi:hypothetical protein